MAAIPWLERSRLLELRFRRGYHFPAARIVSRATDRRVITSLKVEPARVTGALRASQIRSLVNDLLLIFRRSTPRKTRERQTQHMRLVGWIAEQNAYRSPSAEIPA